jgi:hypothetical protein
MATSVERATLNELQFREANEKIEGRRTELELEGERISYLCECEDAQCRELLLLSSEEYRAARVDRRHFLLARGHPFRSGRIAERYEAYMVVLKTGKAAAVIEEEEGSDG